MNRQRAIRRPVESLIVATLLVATLVVPAPASGRDTPASRFKTRALAPSSRITGPGSLSARLARTDRSLVGQTHGRNVNVLVKLDYDPIARSAAAGNARGPAASQLAFIVATEARVVATIRGRIPEARLGRRFRTVYGGVSIRLPVRQIGALLDVPGVVAVQRNRLVKPLTDASPAFIGAEGAWPSLGGASQAGEGVVIGVIDSGVWAEHPSFGDPGISQPPRVFGCGFGDGSDPALGPSFVCNDKLVGAYAFLDDYLDFVGALEGEFCNTSTKECSARDSNGHGTHTATTAAGSPLSSAEVLGEDRGPISGIAPGAHVVAYRVCLELGCLQSDILAAIEQAVQDEVDVINFSISGGADPLSDPVELAFLDAYAAGISVAAAAGNSGPGAGTAEHGGPWVTTVGASTSDRHFFSTLQLSAGSGQSFTATGATVTSGVDPAPVKRAGDVGGYADETCSTPMPAGSADGMVIACSRGAVARIEIGANVAAGGGAGLILYNTTDQDILTDNHFLPAIHIDGPETSTEMLDFIDGHSGVLARWVGGSPQAIAGDVMAEFSARGPTGGFIKPDVTAPGVQILAGNTPEPVGLAAGKPGELFQVIAGTSMSSPHAAGASALIKAAHPDWSPGEVKNALMTTAVAGVVKEDGTTPADPFDMGAGSIRVDRAIEPTLLMDTSADDFTAWGGDPLTAIDLNLASIDASVMPGSIRTTRTVTNVSDRRQHILVGATAPEGALIRVEPSDFRIRPGVSKTLAITIDGAFTPPGQAFGSIRLDVQRATATDMSLPVAFDRRPGAIEVEHSCGPVRLPEGTLTSCALDLTNRSPGDVEPALKVRGPSRKKVRVFAPSGTVQRRRGFNATEALTAAFPPRIDSITPGGSPAGYLPLGSLGVPGFAVADEEMVLFDSIPFLYGSEEYSTIGMSSNGYAVVGEIRPSDQTPQPQNFPDPARPNNVLAPLWTDLNPEAGGTLLAAILEDSISGQEWIVLEWNDVAVFSTPSERHSFQIWVEITAGVEAVHFTYGSQGGPGDPLGLVAGAENREGSSGRTIAGVPMAGSDFTIHTSPPRPGGTTTVAYQAKGKVRGVYDLKAMLTDASTRGTSIEPVTIRVARP